MTAVPAAFLAAADHQTDAFLPPRAWRAAELRVDTRVGRVRLRLVRFGERWLASADSLDGPTLGTNGSPYLAAAAALEPFGVGLAQTMRLVARHAAALP